MIDVRFLKDTVFIIKMVGVCFFCLAITIPYTYLISLMNAKLGQGFDHNYSGLVISSLGMCNCMGRIVCGAIADLDAVSPMMVVVVANGIATVCLLAVNFCYSFWMFIAVAGIYGFCVGPGNVLELK